LTLRQEAATADERIDQEGSTGPGSPTTGSRVVRGSAVRTLGYGVAVLIGLPISVVVLRYLGVADYGKYATVAAILGIVAGVSDLGLTAVGIRDMSRRPLDEGQRLLETLLGVRVLAAAAGVAAASIFALGVGYEDAIVIGVLVAGLGVILNSAQATLAIPLWVSLRIPTLTALDVARPALILAGVIIAVLLGATLVLLLAVQAVVATMLLAATILVVGRARAARPSFDLVRARRLVRMALPVTVATTIGVIYFGSLVVVVSLVGTETDTGLYGTSFRIFELVLALPALVITITLPVLSVAARDDPARFRYALQRTAEVSSRSFSSSRWRSLRKWPSVSLAVKSLRERRPCFVSRSSPFSRSSSVRRPDSPCSRWGSSACSWSSAALASCSSSSLGLRS
jgi:O-antigen/teichoic acid export membrane protein